MSEETSLIQSFVERWGNLAVGIGDDGAVLDIPAGEKLVVSTDAAVEDVHFRRDDISAREIGYRAAAAALSDLAAMAARPRGLLFALVLPVTWRDQANALADGVGNAARASKCPVIGGNISAGEQLSITTTVLGSAKNPLARSGARAGDKVYVTGALGGSAAAVRAWVAGRQPEPSHRSRFVSPVPRIGEAIWLAEQGATSAIDVSDGLATDAGHVAFASSARLTIDVARIPVSEHARIEEAIAGGEDYELIVTAPSFDATAFLKEFNVQLTEVGTVEGGDPGVDFQRDGVTIDAPTGYDHLAEQ